MVKDIFKEEDVKLISQIRPGQSEMQDGYAWVFNNNGDYTVKSGYWVWTYKLQKENEETQAPVNPMASGNITQDSSFLVENTG